MEAIKEKKEMFCMGRRELFELIDKHIEKHKEAVEYYSLLAVMLESEDSIEMVQAHAGAITGLKMLKKELNGEIEY